MYFDVGQMVAQPPNPGAGDQLTIVEFDALQIVTGDQVVEAGIGDERQVVQLQDAQVFRGAGRQT